MSDTIEVTIVSPFPPAAPVEVDVVIPDTAPVTNTNRGDNGVTNTDGSLGFRIFVGNTSPTAAGFTPIIGDVWISDFELEAARLIEMVSAEGYELTAITRNINEVVTSATVKWTDGSTGVFTATAINATWNAIDAYTITHASTSKTITQSLVTRDSAGAITVKPALTIN